MFSLMPLRRERKREPFAPLDLFRREFASLFDRAFAPWAIPFETPVEWTPPYYGIEMEEKEGEVIVYAELPGFEIGELDVRIVGNLLTIVAEHKEVPPKKGEKPIEHRYGKVERTLTLPTGVVPEKIVATFRNGVLELHVPLAPEVMPKRIEVKP
jgi:HSP20 family protein